MLEHLEEYHRPRDLHQALELLRRKRINTVPLAGGTNLALSRSPRLEAVVDLSELVLDFIGIGTTIRLGAMVRLQTMVRASEIRDIAGGVLSEAARREAAYTVRNMATVGGTVAVAESTSELLPLFLALDAFLDLDGGEATVPLTEYLTRKSTYTHRLITAVIFPNPRGMGVGTYRVARLESDEPILTAAVVVKRDGDRASLVRLAMGGIQRRPVRLLEVEGKMLAAGTIDGMLEVLPEVSSAVTHRGNLRASAEYRKEVAPVAARRALLAAWGERG